mmetsp:Transcript_8610/g.16916  ORF Transcript_8610/g.16916 Transcript_8610/m.16916 type:complete len:99 (+) Transcript_8610:226-522(+)|eukprot:CAMPEP_0170171204 /NCGR_PEP_ID=MMETSP0040_2-20121228/4322_1 /TAXON_ID=641309 /ORGANISM="Lotharella oceanica, Strain CCMP622" /LENGTH=98 /DNA_ID=CAMNT_0010411109 /DNA_START=218 /DNA_END=514 /DNA_ORIENTATION=+
MKRHARRRVRRVKITASVTVDIEDEQGVASNFEQNSSRCPVCPFNQKPPLGLEGKGYQPEAPIKNGEGYNNTAHSTSGEINDESGPVENSFNQREHGN